MSLYSVANVFCYFVFFLHLDTITFTKIPFINSGHTISSPMQVFVPKDLEIISKSMFETL